MQEKAIILMVYLCKAEENRGMFRESGCLGAMCDMLDNSHSTILHNAMAVLVNATIGNTKNQNAIRENGAMKKVVGLMMDKKPKTRQNACWLLKKLVTNNHKNADAVREMGCLENIVQLIGTFFFFFSLSLVVIFLMGNRSGPDV